MGASGGVTYGAGVLFNQYDSDLNQGYAVDYAQMTLEPLVNGQEQSNSCLGQGSGCPTTSFSIYSQGQSGPSSFANIGAGSGACASSSPVATASDPTPGSNVISPSLGPTVRCWFANNLSNQWLSLTGSGALRQYYMYLSATLETPPSPSRVVNLAAGSVISSTTPTLTAQPVNLTSQEQTDNLFPMYDYEITTTPDLAAGLVISSGELEGNLNGVTVPSWTVPPGSLRDGTSYYAWVLTDWNANPGPYYGGIAPISPPASWAVPFKVKLDLGAGGPSPTDQVGSVPGQSTTPADGAPSPGLPGSKISVNMVDGNVSFAVATPTLATVGGGLSLGFTYNSLAVGASDTLPGLQGLFYNTSGGTQTLVGSRVDPTVNFQLPAGQGLVSGQIPSQSSATWTGSITFPLGGGINSGDCIALGEISADGMTVSLNNATFINDPGPHGPQTAPLFGTPFVDSGQTDSLNVTVSHSQTDPIVAQLFLGDFGQPSGGVCPAASAQPNSLFPVPSEWLTHTPGVLSPGWTLNTSASNASWIGLEDHGSSVTVYSSDGNGFEFVYAGGGQYRPPVEDPTANLSVDSSGDFVLADGAAGLIYTFNHAGALSEVTSSTDDRNPAALKYTFGATSPIYPTLPELTAIEDPVSTRTTQLYYTPSSSCPTPPSGFNQAPQAGLLCAIHFWDGTQTALYYNSANELAEVNNPGSVVYLFSYDSNGLLGAEMDPLPYAADEAGVRSDCTTNTGTCSTLITYDSSGRAQTVTQPAPLSGAVRPERGYCYSATQAAFSNGSLSCSGTASNATSLAVAGLSPAVGYAQQDVYDSQGRIVATKDAAGRTTSYVWNASDQLVSATKPDGTETSTLYDTQGNPTTSYGPAPAGSFQANGTPTTGASPPTATTGYDAGMSGLAAAWYSNTSLTGSPTSHALAPPTESVNGPTSGQLTGLVSTPTSGSQVSFDGDGGQVLLDGHPYINQMGGPYPAQVRADSPSDWWRLGEGSGATVAADQTGADPGTYHGGVTLGQPASYLTDGDSTAATFDGSTGYVSANDSPALNFSNYQPFSVEAWVKTSFTGDNQSIVAKMTNGGSFAGWQLGTSVTSGNPYFYLVNNVSPSNYIQVTANQSVTNGAWHHIVVTYNGTSKAAGLSFYIDGQSVPETVNNDTLTATAATPGLALNIGSRGQSLYFHGTLGDVSVYPNQVLSATRASAHHNAAGQASASTTGPVIYNYHYPQAVDAATPVAYWRLSDPSTASSAADSWAAYSGTYGAGTQKAQPGAVPGDPATSATFNGGSNSFVQLPAGILPGAGVAQTIETWFKTTASGPLFAYSGNPVGSGAPNGHDTPLYVGTDYKLHGGVWPAVNMASPVKVNDGKWHMAALADDGNGNLSLYLDGQQVASQFGAGAEIAPGYDESLAAGYVSTAWPATPATQWWYYTGSLQDVALYAQALSGPQITQQYQAAFTPWTTATSTDSALSLWRLGELNTTYSAADTLGPNSGTYNGGIALNQPGPLAGDPTTAASFAGNTTSPQYVGLPAGILAGAGSPSSIEAWFKTTSSGPIYAYDNTSPNNGTPTAHDTPLYVGTDGKLHGGVWPAVNMASTQSVNDGNWHQAVFSDDGNGDLTLYLDGKQVATATGAGAETAPGYGESIAAGYVNTSWPATPGSTWWYFNGALSNVALYNQPLSAGQIALHYQDAQTSPGPTSAVHTITVDDQQYLSGGHLNLAATNSGTFDPGYGLATSTSDPDGKTTSTSYSDTNGIGPQYGLPTKVTQDPGGLNLTTTTSYEAPGNGSFLRVIAKTLPAGNQTTYLNYCGYASDPNCNTSSEQQGAFANTCGIATGADQYGLVAQRTDPAPATGAGDALVEQYVYDQTGRQVGVREGTLNTVNNNGWSCTTYDTAGRITSQAWLAFNGQPARTVTYTYSTTNPLTNSVTDTNWTGRSITSTVDLLDRIVSYSDIWANTTTTTFNQAGQMTNTNGPQGNITYGYDQAGEPTTTTLGTTTLATASYNNTTGQMTQVADANGITETLGYDTAGRLTSHTIPTTTATTGETVTYSPGSRIVDQTVYDSGQGKLVDANPTGANYTYDGAGRLTQAALPAATYNYNYGTASTCPTGSDTNAGANTNRTTLTVTGNGAGTINYCYDNADRLLSTSTIPDGQITYDGHGNTTQEGNQTFTYDSSDQVTRTDTPTNVTIYQRDPLNRPAQQTFITPITAQGTSNASTTTASSVTLTNPAGIQPGDLLVATITAAAGTPAAPSGWNIVAQQANGTNTTWVADHTDTSGDPNSWTFSQGVPTTILAAESDYRNANAAQPIDVTATQNDTAGTSQPLPQVTTTANADTVLHVVGYDTTTTPSAPSGDTTRYSTSSTLASLLVSDRYQPDTGQTPAESATSTLLAPSQAITIALEPATTTQRLGYTGQTDTTAVTQDNNGNTQGTTIPLPAGQTYNTTPNSTIWSYTNNHGDTITTTDNNGNPTWTGYWGPYGENPTGTPPPTDTALTGLTYGYNGSEGKLTSSGANLILMGNRPYQPATGRFTQPDPIQGGCANDYTYGFGDPLNKPDISGQAVCFSVTARQAGNLAEKGVLANPAVQIAEFLDLPNLIGDTISAAVDVSAVYLEATADIAKAYARGQRMSGIPKGRNAVGMVAVMVGDSGGVTLQPWVAHGYGWKSKDPCASGSLFSIFGISFRL